DNRGFIRDGAETTSDMHRFFGGRYKFLWTKVMGHGQFVRGRHHATHTHSCLSHIFLMSIHSRQHRLCQNPSTGIPDEECLPMIEDIIAFDPTAMMWPVHDRYRLFVGKIAESAFDDS